MAMNRAAEPRHREPWMKATAMTRRKRAEPLRKSNEQLEALANEMLAESMNEAELRRYRRGKTPPPRRPRRRRK